MKALIVIQLTYNEQVKAFEEGRDYTFINPSHVCLIESRPLDVLTFDEDMNTMIPRQIFTYRVVLVGGAEINCTVEDREFFLERLVGSL